MSMSTVWILAAGIVPVGVLLYLLNRLARRWRRNSHPALFSGLCRLHGLDLGARQLLKQVVQYYRLIQPARLFIEPQWLDPARLRGPLQARAAELTALRGRLFGLDPPDAASG
jgi:hypothetical protein